ncbi:hypothetical protein [Dysgonomonas macrotermitis]|nr:hypothetical protein [Dysgonomonas macrotermitis]
MKKKMLLLMGIFSFGISYAQVGINTQNPQGIFHVDPNSNTTGGIAAPVNDEEDVIVTNDGKVGIGTITPEVLLEIKTAGTQTSPVPGFQLQDGNEAEGNILLSVGNTGLATWQNVIPASTSQLVTSAAGITSLTFNDVNYYNSNSYIVLPPGRWALNVVSLISGTGTLAARTPVWVSSTLADDSTAGNSGGSLASVKSPDIEGMGLISGICWSYQYMTICGSMIINNTSNASKTYYYMAGGTSSFGVSVTGSLNRVGGSWGEINIIAYRIPSDL